MNSLDLCSMFCTITESLYPNTFTVMGCICITSDRKERSM